MRPAHRRLAVLTALFALSLLSCGREVTGPDNGFQYGRPRHASLALDPQMPSLFASLEGAGDVVAFENVWVVLRDEDGNVVFDSLVAFPVGADSVALTITIPIPLDAPAAGLPLQLTMAYVNATGDTVFRGGPAPVTAAPVGSSGSSQPITIPIVYDGVGKNATSVVLTPAVDTVVAGTSSTFTAIARDATNATIPLTPILFYTLDSARASVPNVGVGSVTWLPSRGIARIVAALPDGQPSDTSYVMVKLPASQLVLGSGGGQSGTFGVALANPIVVRTLASDNVPVPGVIVTFAVATGGGSVATLVDTSDANGDVSTSWTLGNTIGAQSITATAAGLTGSPLTITGTATAGAPFRVLITQQPTSATAGQTLTPSVVARVQDNAGNTVTTFTGPVTVVLDTGVAGALNGTTTRNAVAGIATFNDLSLTAIGMARIIASSGALLADESDSIAVAPGATARLEFSAQPTSASAGSAIVPPVVVLARDAFGNPTPAFTGNVTIGINTGAVGATLGGASTVAATAGVATFSALTLDKVGAYTLLASGSGLVPDTSATFSITAAGAATLQLISGDAQTGTAGSTLTDSLVVRVVDAFSNPVAGVQVAFVTTSGSVSPDTLLTDANGRASAAWTLGTAAGLRTAKATSAGLVDVTFSATATAAAAVALQFDAQPQDTLIAGIAGGSIVISARDAFGNLVTTQPGSVNIGFTYNPQGGSIVSGSGLQAFAGGVATFTGIAIDKAGKYVLDFSSSGLTAAFSDTVTVIAGAPANVAIVSGTPQTGSIGAALGAPLVLHVEDAFGNPIVGHNVTWTPTLGGGSATPTTSLTNAAGNASTTWTLGNLIGAQTLNAIADGFGALQFSATATAGTPTTIEFQTAPQGVMIAGTPASSIVVAVKDAQGNVVTSYSGFAKLSLLTQPVGATILAGGDSVAFTAGLATFPGLTLDKAGAYRLQFNAGAFAALLSDTITVNAGAADTIVMVSGNNQTGEPNTTLAAPVRVRVFDAYGNPVANVGVTYSVVSGDADPAITTVFTDSTGLSETEIVVHDTVGTLTIHATASGVNGSPVVFTATIQSASPTQVNLTASPTTSIAGNITSSFAVELRDAQNALATAYTDTVRFVVLVGPVGAPAGGKTKAVPVGGIASFDDLSFNIRGAYQIGIVADGVADTAFATLTVTAANANAISMAAGDGTTGTVLGLLPQPMIVQVTDVFGNAKPGVTVNWDVVSGDASVTNPTMVTDTNGYAFTSVNLGATPGAVQVQASVSGLTGSPVTFNATATAGAATHLRVETEPLDAAAADSIAPFSVSARDSLGNLDVNYGGTVTVTVDSGPAGSALSGIGTVSVISGIATFQNLYLTKAGVHRLRFTSSGLSDTLSALFTITATTPAGLQAAGGDAQTDTVTQTLPVPLSARVTDVYSNPISGHAVAWTVVSGDATVGSDTTYTDATGIANVLLTFGGAVGTVTVHATSAGLLGSPVVFTEVAVNDTLDALVLQSAPDTVVAGSTLPSIVIRAVDAHGNTIADFAGTVSMSVSDGPAGFAAGTLTRAASSGVATFDDLQLNAFGNYTLLASYGSVAIPAFVVVTQSAAASFEFVTQPATEIAGETLSPIIVRARDAFGNIAASFDSVTISIDSSAVDAVLTGTLTLPGTGGLAVFNDLRLNRSGLTRFRVEFAGITAAISDTLRQLAGAPDSIALYNGDAQVDTVNSTLTNPLQVIVFDSLGNGVPNQNVTWAVDSGYATLNDSTVDTDSLGVSTVIVTLGDSIGPVYLSATLGGAAGSPIQFVAVALNAPATRLVIDVEPSPAIAGQTMAPIVVSARDSLMNFALNFAENIDVSIDSGPAGAILGGSTSVGPGAGIATFTDLTLDKVGNYRLRFTATGLADTVTGVFPVTAAAATDLVMVSGEAQTDTVAQILPNPLRVRVTDAFGNGVSGQFVVWTITSGSALLGADSTATDAAGYADVLLQLGTVAGGITVDASVIGLTGSPVTFTATAVEDTVTQIVVVTSMDTVMSGAFATYDVQARDMYGNVVTSCACPISVAIASGPGAFVAGTTSQNFSGGVVSFSDLVFGSIGNYTLVFTSGAFADTVTTDVVVGAGASFVQVSGDNQTGMILLPLDSALVVRIQDAQGNGRQGDTVMFNVALGAGLLGGGLQLSDTVLTDVNGYASTTWKLGVVLGAQAVTASATGFSDIGFNATATVMVANKVWTGNVDTDISNGANWKDLSAPLVTDSVLFPAGRTNYPVLNANFGVEALTIEDGATFNMNGWDVIVSRKAVVPSTLAFTAGGAFYMNGTSGEVQGAFTSLGIQSGAFVASGPISTTDNLRVFFNGSLDFGALTHNIGTDLQTQTSGTIAQSAGGVINVAGYASFTGASTAGLLTGGTLNVGGDFTTGGDVASFSADSAHTVVFNGPATQTVTLASPDATFAMSCSASCFGNVMSSKGAGGGALIFASDAKALGGFSFNGDSLGASNVTLVSGAPMNFSTAVTTAHRVAWKESFSRVGSVAIDTLFAWGDNGDLGGTGEYTTVVVGTRTFGNSTPSTAAIIVEGNLHLNGIAEIQNDLITRGTGRLWMQEASDTLYVWGAFTAGADIGLSDTTFAAGFLQLSNSLLQTNSGAVSLRSSAAHTTRFIAATPSLSTAYPGNSLGTVTVTNLTTLNITGSLDLTGNAVIEGTGAGSIGGGTEDTLSIHGSLVDATGGRWQHGATKFVGLNANLPDSVAVNVVIEGSWTPTSTVISGDLTVRGSGQVFVGGSLHVQDLSIYDNANLEMIEATDSVFVSGNFTFNSGSVSPLYAGYLEIIGHFSQAGSGALIGQPAHSTWFKGPANSNITFGTPGFGGGESRFGELYLSKDPSVPVTVLSDVFADGKLETGAAAAYAVNGAGQKLVSRGADVNDITFTNVRWHLLEGQAIDTLIGVKFSSMNADSVQFYIERNSGTVTLDTPYFFTTPTTGRYLVVADADGGSDLFVNVVTPTPSFHGGRVLETNGAVITGWTDFSALNWSGLVDQNWANAGNWAEGRAPLAADSVYVGPSFPAGQMPVISIAPVAVRSLQIDNTNPLLVYNNALTITQRLTASNNSQAISCADGTGDVVMAPSDTAYVSGYVHCRVNFSSGVSVLADSALFDSVTVSNSARLDLNGSYLQTAGAFVVQDNGVVEMTDAGGHLRLFGAANFGGSTSFSDLTEGTVTISGDFVQSGLAGYATANNHVTNIVYDALYPASTISFANPSSNVQRLDIDGPLTMNSNVTVGTNVTLGPLANVTGTTRLVIGGQLRGNQGSSLTLNAVEVGALFADSGTYAVDTTIFTGAGQIIPLEINEQDVTYTNVRVTDAATMVGAPTLSYTILGDLILDGALSVPDSSTLVVAGSLFTRGTGTLVMNTSNAAIVQVRGDAEFRGGNTSSSLLYGTLRVSRSFVQSNENSDFSFSAGGSHVTVLDSTGIIQFATPGSSRFHILRINSATNGSYTLNSDVPTYTFETDGESSDSVRLYAGAGYSTSSPALSFWLTTLNEDLVLENVRLRTEYGFFNPASVTFRNFGASTSPQFEVTAPFNSIPSGAMTFDTLQTTPLYVRVEDTNLLDSAGDTAAFFAQNVLPVIHGGNVQVGSPGTELEFAL